jgi:rare lipoprotein A
MRGVALALIAAGCSISANSGNAHENAVEAASLPSAGASTVQPKLDYSGRKRVGVASFYAQKFAGRKMADGNRMDPHGNNAASRTLPLGTTARVTNLETGQNAIIQIQDRGPYVKGRIIDLSPSTARAIGIDKETGVALVQVVPIEIPPRDGANVVGTAATSRRADDRGSGE